MKILLVNTRHFPGGGDSTYTFNLSELLCRNGHETAYFAMQDPRNIPDPNADLFVSNIDFRELNKQKSITNGVRVVSRTIYSTEARRKFRVLLDRFQPDIIHLQNIHSHITPSILFEAKQCKLPVVWTLHDYRMTCPNSHYINDRTGEICEACRNGRFYNAVLKRCKKGSLAASGIAAFETYVHLLMGVDRQTDAYLTPSAFLKRKMVENGFREDRVFHLPLFLTQQNFWSGEEDGGYILFLGKLEAIKGIEVLIEAARRAPNVAVTIAGRVEEPLASRLPDILPGNAAYVGLKHGQELADLTRNALAVVVPSIWYENQPFSILEAFAAGKPVIASDLGGMTELVANRERGLLVKPGDAAGLAEAMNILAANRDFAKEMGRSARKYALDNHSGEKHYQSLMQIYDRVLKK